MKQSPAVWLVSLESTPLELRPFPMPDSARSLDEISAALPAGAYTTLRTYRGEKALRLADHFQRLEQTASLAKRPIKLDQNVLRRFLRQSIHLYRSERRQQEDVSDLRIRLTLDLEVRPGDLYLAIQPLPPIPQEYYLHGVQAITCDLQRLLPEAKLTRFIDRSQHIRRLLTDGLNEAILVDNQGRLLEGLSSNFFAVLQGELRTAGEGVLAGITRSLTLECANKQHIPVRLEAVHRSALPELEEAFITSSSRGILPIRQLDEIEIGVECPGLLTRRLMQDFEEAIEEQIESI